MTGKEVWEATDRMVPEHTVHLILGQMAHKGLEVAAMLQKAPAEGRRGPRTRRPFLRARRSPAIVGIR